ncbi:DUF4145 domain-containing protein [Anaerococcus sp. Marseille-P3915]|uniref:DUF4145 domain-containing protein n=1 Tax=Anaerococcus sp. Marseille-P3915 TaxID=2057799 RepID=UPI001F20120E|nr:DUF4145 domain-containing protein [Anaerococcus sp. Marseille-P3915]
MNDYLECPFCKKTFPLTKDTFSESYPAFDSNDWKYYIQKNSEDKIKYPHLDTSGLKVQFNKCPACKKVTIDIIGVGSQFPEGFKRRIFPASEAKKYPDYIPSHILEDYTEAYDILELSPKASATLSRRCLQSMIRDKWDTNEKTLYKEIDSIRDKVDSKTWDAINALRKIGNIGAHMQKDTSLIINIEPWEAEKLILLIINFTYRSTY